MIHASESSSKPSGYGVPRGDRIAIIATQTWCVEVRCPGGLRRRERGRRVGCVWQAGRAVDLVRKKEWRRVVRLECFVVVIVGCGWFGWGGGLLARDVSGVRRRVGRDCKYDVQFWLSNEDRLYDKEQRIAARGAHTRLARWLRSVQQHRGTTTVFRTHDLAVLGDLVGNGREWGFLLLLFAFEGQGRAEQSRAEQIPPEGEICVACPAACSGKSLSSRARKA